MNVFNNVPHRYYRDAQEIGCPSGTLGIYYNGAFKTHELMSRKKIETFIQKVKI